MIAAGTRIGRYELLALLGAGGMGEVYRARDVQLGREVAIKVIASTTSADPLALDRFEREARAAAALSHPSIIAVHDIGTHEGCPFLVTELLEGETLRVRLARGALDLRAGLDIAIQLAHGLAAAHARGIVHRDFKPDNVFLTSAGTAKILDFGLAKLARPGQHAAELDVTTRQLTKTGVVLGTVGYMSPEQVESARVDHRTDQFGFGVLVYEMFGGRRPFQRATVHETLAAIVREEPDSLSNVRSDVPAPLARVVARCLAKDPEARYQSTRDLALTLQEVRDELGAASGKQEVAKDTGWRRRPAPLAAAVISAALLIVAAGGAWLWFASAPGRPSRTTVAASVAVLPFRTIGEGEQYFADGITEAVTTELGRVGGLRVIASNAAFAYRNKGDSNSLRDVARRLGVELLVQGAVQRVAGTVRIDASLVDPQDDSAIWSERYNRQLTDILAVQDDIARQIATTLSERFGTAVRTPTGSRATIDANAYDAYLRGVSYLKGRRPGAARTSQLVEAVAELERAVGIDRNFAVAHAALASAYTQRFFYDAPDPSFEQRASLEIDTALAIDPNLADAYLARAQLLWNLRNRFPHERAVGDLKKALLINPNLADAYIELGKIYYHVGLTDKSFEANDRALRLDPTADVALNRKMLSLVDDGRFGDVLRELDRPGSLMEPYARADALVAMDKLEGARQILENGWSLPASPSIAPLYPSRDGLLAVIYVKLGRGTDAQRILAALMPHAQNPTGLSDMHHAQFHIGSALALLGRHDEAVVWLTAAANEGYPSLPRFTNDRALAALKRHPGFEKLLDQLRKDRQRWLKML